MFDARKIASQIGSALTVGGVIFVIYRLAEYGKGIDPQKVESISWPILVSLALAYCMASFFLVLAWREIMVGLGERIGFAMALRLYGISQIAKYLPGNVFHLGSRQALGMAEGFAGRTLGKSVFWEVGLLVSAALLFSILILPKFLVGLSWKCAFLLFFAAVTITGLFVVRLAGANFSRSFCGLVIFFLLAGLVFYFVVRQVSNLDPVQAPLFIGAFVVSWLAGFLTPGSPAGMGVRELLLLILLKDVIVEADLIVSIVLARGVSVLGDVWLLVAAKLFANFMRGSPNV